MYDDSTLPVNSVISGAIDHPRYRDLGPLGLGGTGEVRRVHDRDLDRVVALKVLTDGAPQRLLSEARAAALLRHPGIVPVYDAGSLPDGRWFFTMPVVEGDALDVALSRHDLRGRILQIRALIEIMADAHAAGLAHMDLKPANVLVEAGGPLVLDWGLAALAGGARYQSAGTPRYLAPERLNGGDDPQRSDVYSLGGLLLLALTGHPPWSALPDPDSIVVQLRLGRTPPVPTVPSRLAAIGEVVRRALHVDPERRPADARGLLMALDSALPHLQVEAEPCVGRDDALDWLSGTFGAGVRFAALTGPAGVGKTHVARAWVERRAWTLFDRVASVSLSTAPTVALLEQRVAGALGVRLADAPLAEALASMGDLLLVLQSAELGTDVIDDVVSEWLRSAEGLRVLITSRRGAQAPATLRLAPLSTSSARALFALRVARASDPYDHRLVDQLDGLPLALVLAAARARRLGSRAVHERMDRRFRLLRGERLDLRSSLDASWTLLPQDARELLAGLTVFETSFDLAAVEAIVDPTCTRWALDILDDLVDHSMIEPLGDGLYALLDSMRAFAAEHVVDVVALRRKHAGWFAEHTDELVVRVRRFTDAQSRRDLARLVPELRAAALHAPDDDAAGRCLAALLEHTRQAGPFLHAIELVDAVLQARPALSPRLRALCLVLALECSWDRAVDEGLQARALAASRACADPDLTARVLTRKAAYLRDQGGARQALELLDEALAMAGATHASCYVHRERVSCLLKLGDIEGAEHDALPKALTAARRWHDRDAESKALYVAGIIYTETGRAAQAEASHLQALAICEHVGSDVDAGRVMYLLGTLHLERGRLDEARRLLHRSCELLEPSGSRLWLGMVLGTMGNMYRLQGDLAKARQLLLRCLTTHERSGRELRAALAGANLGSVYADEGDRQTAVGYWRTVVNVAEKHGAVRMEGAFRIKLADAARELGRLDEALCEARLAIERTLTAGDPVYLALAHVAQGRVYLDRLDRGEARACLERADVALQAQDLPDSTEVMRARSALIELLSTG